MNATEERATVLVTAQRHADGSKFIGAADRIAIYAAVREANPEMGRDWWADRVDELVLGVQNASLGSRGATLESRGIKLEYVIAPIVMHRGRTARQMDTWHPYSDSAVAKCEACQTGIVVPSW